MASFLKAQSNLFRINLAEILAVCLFSQLFLQEIIFGWSDCPGPWEQSRMLRQLCFHLIFTLVPCLGSQIHGVFLSHLLSQQHWADDILVTQVRKHTESDGCLNHQRKWWIGNQNVCSCSQSSLLHPTEFPLFPLSLPAHQLLPPLFSCLQDWAIDFSGWQVDRTNASALIGRKLIMAHGHVLCIYLFPGIGSSGHQSNLSPMPLTDSMLARVEGTPGWELYNWKHISAMSQIPGQSNELTQLLFFIK